MARSRRKTPICSITVSGFNRGEKDEKRDANRKARRITNQKLTSDPYNMDDIIFIDKLREISEIWSMRKDGKQYLDPDENPKSMRK
jgi:hypothetical protein